MSAADTMIQFALAQVGKPYIAGGTGPAGYDCSGLVQAAAAAAGISLPRTTYQQVLKGTPVSRASLMPGDLLFPDPGHVSIYLGNNQVVEAPHTGENVHVINVWGFWTARRIAPPASNVSFQPIADSPGQANNPCYDVYSTGAGPVFVWNGKCPDSQKGQGPQSAPSLPGEDQLGSIMSALGSVASSLGWITQGHNWVRIAEFAAGMLLLIMGTIGLGKAVDSVKAAGKAVVKHAQS